MLTANLPARTNRGTSPLAVTYTPGESARTVRIAEPDRTRSRHIEIPGG